MNIWEHLNEAHNLTFVTFQHKYRQLTKLQALQKKKHMCSLFVFLDTMFPRLLLLHGDKESSMEKQHMLVEERLSHAENIMTLTYRDE